MIQETGVVHEVSSASDCAVRDLPYRTVGVRSRGITSDREALMQLLSSCLPLVEAANATTALLDCYGNYAEVVAAPSSELQGFACLGEHGAHLLKCVHAAAIHLAAAPLQRVTSVTNWTRLSAYLNTSMAREKSEVFRVLFLNPKNHVISDQVLGQGTTSEVSVSIREVAHKSLQVGATAILLIHNHPSGDPMPSTQDLIVTRKLEDALTLLGICLHDHIIVGKGRCFSLRTMEFLPSHGQPSPKP